MATAQCLWAGGTNTPTQVALRGDGAYFQRYRRRDDRGLTWSPWRMTKRTTLAPDFKPDRCISIGVAILSLVPPPKRAKGPAIRLPND